MNACSAPSAPNATRTYSLVSMTISHIGRILPRIHQVEWCHSIRYFSYIPNWMHHATPTSRTVEQSKQSIRKKILMGEYRISIWLRQTSIHKQRHVSGSNILLLFVQISSHSPWSSHWKCVFACIYVVCVCGLTNAVLHFVFFMLLLSQTNQDRNAIPILQFIQPYYIRVPKPKTGLQSTVASPFRCDRSCRCRRRVHIIDQQPYSCSTSQSFFYSLHCTFDLLLSSFSLF